MQSDVGGGQLRNWATMPHMYIICPRFTTVTTRKKKNMFGRVVTDPSQALVNMCLICQEAYLIILIKAGE